MKENVNPIARGCLSQTLGYLPTNSLFKLRLEFIDLVTFTNSRYTFSNVVTAARGGPGFVPISASVGGFTVALTNVFNSGRLTPLHGEFAATLQPPDAARRFECLENLGAGQSLYIDASRVVMRDGYCEGAALAMPPRSPTHLTFVWPRKRVVEVIVRPQGAATEPLVLR